MKQTILAVTAAALIFLSACNATTLPADVPVESAKPETSAADPQSTPDEVVTLPADELKPESVVDGWFDEPQTVQDDIEEVVTYTLRIPHLTLASDAASEAINDGMAQLQSALESYADDEVYKAALDAQAMAFVDGDYTISMADGKLILTYTLSVRYGVDGAAEVTEKIYTFDAATGEFILFVDSDDWIDPAYCERLYEAAREAEADIACASMLKIRPSYSKWTIHYTERQVAAEAQEKFRLCRCPPDFYVMNKLLRREMLLRLGLRFRERVCYEDVEYTMRLLGEGGVLVTVPDVVYRYVVNGASITKSRQTPKKQQDKYLAHKAFVAYADARGIRLDARFRRITRRSFGRWGLTWLKIKECGDRETYRLFDLIPVWRKRVTDKQACDGH